MSAPVPSNEQFYEAIRAGSVLADKYRVDSTLGVGGFGIVLAATHVHLDEKVAIKLLLPEAAQNPEAVARFLREAKAAVKIRGEHVARVTDVGTLPLGLPYMVMEHLDGQDLSAVVKSAGGQAVPHVVEWVLQSLEAIAEAHAAGMVHRDLKPANLFLTRRPDGTASIKVLDFGISKVASLNPEDKGMTKTSDVMGSPYYMSPEQMKSTRDVDARTDIWALGTILYEMISGHPPFDGETMPALLANILQEPPRNLCELRPDVHPTLWAVIYRCLEKRPDDRFANVAELAMALAPFGPPAAHRSVDRVRGILGLAAPTASTPGIGAPVYSIPSAPGSDAGLAGGAVSGQMHPAVSAASASWGNTVGAPQNKSRTALAIVVGAAVLLLGGLGAVVAVSLSASDSGERTPAAKSDDGADDSELGTEHTEVSPGGEDETARTEDAADEGNAAGKDEKAEAPEEPASKTAASTSTAAAGAPSAAAPKPAAGPAATRWKPAKPDKEPVVDKPPPPPPSPDDLFGGQN